MYENANVCTPHNQNVPNSDNSSFNIVVPKNRTTDTSRNNWYTSQPICMIFVQGLVISHSLKTKSSPILIIECWARSWSRCTGSQPTGDYKSSPSGRLPLPSARPAFYLRKCSPDSATPNWGIGHLIAAYSSSIDPEGMKGWVGLVGWPIADGLPT